ncbi:MAG TPA: alkaline phosphatase PhoX [Microthrixaceae bacterium]|nr:alkaline phosphatase PhoX [Microthrixaceae bacterium]
MQRRTFLSSAIAAGGGAAMVPTAFMVLPAGAQPVDAQPGTEGPYGSIADRVPDANGLVLPEGFTSRIIGVAGEKVEGTEYSWPIFPDGSASFDDGDGGWYFVCNSEVFAPEGNGGASSVHFGKDGEVLSAQRVLGNTTANCAGGPTPWGTWLSCEERFDEKGQVWECDPTGKTEAVVHPALGSWAHEAVAVDPEGKALYLTQDNPEGLFYRFTPDSYPDLSSGKLEAMIVAADESVTWGEVTDPSGETAPTRTQVPGATIFPGNEGCWYHDGFVVWTSKGTNKVHSLDIATQKHATVWAGTPNDEILAGKPAREPLSGVDNITVENGSGDLFVAEDGGNMEVVLISAEGEVVPFARIDGAAHEGSEVTGPSFNPAGDRLYFSSQRGPTNKSLMEIAGLGGDGKNGGVTYEVTGPFRGAKILADKTKEETPNPSDTLVAAGSGKDTKSKDTKSADGYSSNTVPLIAGGAVVAAAVVAGAMALRKRGSADSADGGPGNADTTANGTAPKDDSGEPQT